MVVSAPVVNSDSGKLPQDSRKANSEPENRPGNSTGSVTSFSTCQRVAPRSKAASSNAGSKLYTWIEITSVTTGTIQTRCANTALFQDSGRPSALNHRSSARPSTDCGKKIGSNTIF